MLLVQIVAVGAAWFLRARERVLRQQLPFLLSLAIGVLFAMALLHLLPEAVKALGNRSAVWTTVGGTLLILFCIERLFQAFAGAPDQPALDDSHADLRHAAGALHRHDEDCAGHKHHNSLKPVTLVLASMLHSLVDGVTVASAFAAGRGVGILTAFAVALHEVPHRLGDVAVLLHLGLPIRRALRLAIWEGVPAVVGALAVALLGYSDQGSIRWLLPVSAGSFLYIAAVNLLPELEVESRPARALAQLLALGIGVLLVLGVTRLNLG